MENKDFLIKYDSIMEETILCRYVGKEKIVQIPEGVTTIRKNAFANDFEPNETIEKIILSSSVLKVEEEAFAYCRKLKEIIFNEEVEDIDFSCLTGCDEMEEIFIPPRIEAIISFTKPWPAKLKKIHVNDNLKHVGESAFDIYRKDIDDFERHTSEVLSANPVYKIIGGFMVNTKFMSTLYRTDKSEKDVRVPDGIKEIGTNTFDEMAVGLHDDEIGVAQWVETVVLPKSVEKVNFSAFSFCRNLCSVKYEGESKDLEINEDAFIECKRYTEHEHLIECNDVKISSKQKRITHLMLERFRIIHRKIKSGSFPNTEDLRQICRDELGLNNKLSIATISRDIEYLRNSLEAPIEYDRYHNGYYYTEPFELKL